MWCSRSDFVQGIGGESSSFSIVMLVLTVRTELARSGRADHRARQRAARRRLVWQRVMANLIQCGERVRAVLWRLFPLMTCLALAASLVVAADAANAPAESLELQVK